jgi:3D (Asp-Asp-Asp) domain-containing protein
VKRAIPARDASGSGYPRWVRVRSWRPLLLVVLALALPVAHAGPTAAAIGTHEQAALQSLFATDAALARARAQADAAQARLVRARDDLHAVRQQLDVAVANQRAPQRALAARLNEIYRTHPLDTLGVLLASRSWSQASASLDLLNRLSRQDSLLVRSARQWRTALKGRSRTLRAAEGRARDVQGAWEARAATLGRADQAQRALLARFRREHVRALAALAAAARRAVVRSRTIVRPEPHGGGSTAAPATAPVTTAASTAPAATTAPAPAPKAPSLAPGTTLSVTSTAYSLPGHTASGLPVGVGICATDPRVIPLGTRFDVPGYGSCVAADTGSSVVGADIDIWMPNAQAAVYGTQTITITFR